MSATIRKPQRTFLAVTVLTVIAVTTVFMVYAAVLSTYLGSTVTVNQTGGSMQYSLDGSAWSTSLAAINNGTSWYSRINITGAASQAVTIAWVLQKDSGTWTDQSTPVTTTMTLSVGLNTIYATTSGTSSGNYNWGQLTTSGGSYRVKAVVNG